MMLTGCGSDPDIDALRENIRTMSLAAEEHDTATIIEYLDENYKGVGGSRSGVATLLEQHFGINKNINLIISDIDIILADDRKSAKVNLRMLMTGGQGNIPERGRLNAIKSEWKKTGENWLVTSARWQPVLIQL